MARLFAETGICRAPVIQERLLGIISVTDLLMKPKISAQPAGDTLSSKIRTNLLHNRIAADAQMEIDQECESAWDVVEGI